jgi:hypothetical protein
LSYNTHIHGKVTRKIPLALSQINKNTFFFKQKSKTGPVWNSYWGEGGRYKEGVQKVNIVEIFCTHVCK